MRIRRLQLKDVEAVSRIEAETFRMPWSPQDFADLVKARNALYLVAEEEGEIAGCCGMTIVVPEGFLSNVAVRENFRRKGIGEAMLRRLIGQAREKGVRDITLEVRASNTAAIHFYKKIGFLSEGIRPDFYQQPREDALIMWLYENGRKIVP
ncbi:MAG: ribosomal protein S18-alanine N-acetyltransferase [Clostridium sp.]|jgi:ribosomal-protein-alanine N-acetyltransferase|nr:ribosomal protein S18-alanine N-acetyltransferase [Clostridium sp.]